MKNLILIGGLLLLAGGAYYVLGRKKGTKSAQRGTGKGDPSNANVPPFAEAANMVTGLLKAGPRRVTRAPGGGDPASTAASLLQAAGGLSGLGNLAKGAKSLFDSSVPDAIGGDGNAFDDPANDARSMGDGASVFADSKEQAADSYADLGVSNEPTASVSADETDLSFAGDPTL